MKWVLRLAKLTLSLVWLVLIVNLFMPFPGKMAFVFYILMAFLVMMHLLQLLIFLGAFGDRIPTTSRDKIGILLFGVFGLLSLIHKPQP